MSSIPSDILYLFSCYIWPLIVVSCLPLLLWVSFTFGVIGNLINFEVVIMTNGLTVQLCYGVEIKTVVRDPVGTLGKHGSVYYCKPNS